MISSLRINLFFIILFSSQLLFSQIKTGESNLAIIEKNEWKKDLSGFDSHLDFFQNEKENLGLAKAEDLKFHQIVETRGGWKHTKYHQFYQDIPVLNGVYILHEKAGVLQKANGNLLPNIDIKTTPAFSAKAAIETAKWEALDIIENENKGELPEGNKFRNHQKYKT